MFITIHGYKNNFNEVADYSLCWHVNYLNAVQKSYDIINNFVPSTDFCIEKPYNIEDLKAAHKEWLESLADTLVLGPGNNPRATSAHMYDVVVNKKGEQIPGVKVHRDQGVLHLTALYRLAKIVHVPGKYPIVHSNPKTIAKNHLRALTPLRRWGQFKLEIGRFRTMTVNKIRIKEKDVMRKWND